MIQIFKYNGRSVAFIKADNTVYVNGSELGFITGFSPEMYLRRGEVKEKLLNPTTLHPVTEKPHGDNKGIWLHKDIALDFAGWRSSALKEWIAQTINGFTQKPKKIVKPKPAKAPVLKVSYTFSYELKTCYTA